MDAAQWLDGRRAVTGRRVLGTLVHGDDAARRKTVVNFLMHDADCQAAH